MKILIIHDRPDAAGEITDLLHSSFYGEASCTVAYDSVSARKELAEKIFDLCVIDLTLPVSSKGGRSDYRVAQDLLRELFEHDTMFVPGDIIGITKEAGALSGIEGALGKHLMTMIEEDPRGDWRERLVEKAKYAHRGAYTRQISSTKMYDVDCVLVTALDEEMRPYRKLFGLSDIPHYSGAQSFAFVDRHGEMRRGVAYAIGRAGPAWAASRAQSLISMFRPRLIMMSGFCGGVASKARLGDLIAFEAAVDWDYGRWEREGEELVFRSRPLPLPIVGSPAHRAIREMVDGSYINGDSMAAILDASEVKWPKAPRFYLASAGSGGAVVADKEIVSRIRSLSDSIKAIDMESYGVYNAAQHTHASTPDVICVKTVADMCDADKDDVYHALGSEMSAQTLFDLITRHYNFS